jgi:hypothetical protein
VLLLLLLLMMMMITFSAALTDWDCAYCRRLGRHLPWLSFHST